MANNKVISSNKAEKNDENRPRNNRKPNYKGKGNRRKPKEEKLDESRSNNPAWYFRDERLADQVSQLSFQQLAGYPIPFDGTDFDVPNIVRVNINPAPGVQTSNRYNTALSQHAAINMAGFRMYSKLSAFTGRTSSYAPQDIATAELAIGEVISQFEFIRRGFGVAYTSSPRNRDYPRQLLNFGMRIDADDLFVNLSNYRTRFNTLVTLFNSIAFPKSIAYFDKCASLYEKIYLDSPSSMAQTIVLVPLTSWILDETSYSGGSILKTIPICSNASFGELTAPKTMAQYLTTLEQCLTALLNSSTLNIIYSDIMNYASKNSVEFWRMDYLMDGYGVIPEYDLNFLLQFHNMTFTGMPCESVFVTSPVAVTPYNDVYPDPNNNSLYYNPAFPILTGGPGHARTGSAVIVDMLTDAPNVTDRVEVTRYISITDGTAYTTSTSVSAFVDAALPDHFASSIMFEQQTSLLSYNYAGGTLMNEAQFRDVATQIANIDWAPRFMEIDTNTGLYTGRSTGEVNFYTVIDELYLRKLHDFCGLDLYNVAI